MPPELISILAQIPIVAAFIWYSDRVYKQFMSFLIEQRTEDRQAIMDLTAEIKSVAACITHQQEATTKDHAVMLERLSREVKVQKTQ